jgi:hypothetical protein
MNDADKFFWRNVNEAKRDYMQRMADERKRRCKAVESGECDGKCFDCRHLADVAFTPPLPGPEYVENNSVCPDCGRGYLSEHGGNWTCRECKKEHPCGELEFWE